MYGNENGLINQIAAFSLTKSFGQAKIKTQSRKPDVRELRKKPDFPKVDESLTTQDYEKDLKKSDTKIQKLTLLATKTLQENQISKHLIKELLKENQKLKSIVEIFKNKANQNKKIFNEVNQSLLNKSILLNFILIFVTVVLVLTTLIALIYNKIRFRP